MPASTIGRFKLYPKEDPRLAFYPSQGVAQALPSLATQTFSFTSPRPRVYVVESAPKNKGRGLGSQRSGTTVTTSSSGVSLAHPQVAAARKPQDPVTDSLLSPQSSTSAAAAAAAATVAAVVKTPGDEVPDYSVIVEAPSVFASSRRFRGDVVDAYGLKTLTVRGTISRSNARYEIFDCVNMCSTKGMPTQLPIFTLNDTGGSGGALLDATLVKQGRPILRLRVDKALSGNGDVVWVGRDPETDAELVVISDFISQPGVPPSVSVRATPPFSIDLPLTSCLWACLWDLYSRRTGGQKR